jgi:hypothetical protein
MKANVLDMLNAHQKHDFDKDMCPLDNFHIQLNNLQAQHKLCQIPLMMLDNNQNLPSLLAFAHFYHSVQYYIFFR